MGPGAQPPGSTQLRRTARNGTPASTGGSFGSPRTRSPMMLRWISSVPPTMDWLGTETSTSATRPPAGESGPLSRAPAPAISPWTCAACRAMWLLSSLPSDPSGPGVRPDGPGRGGPLAQPPPGAFERVQRGQFLADDRSPVRPGGAGLLRRQVGAPGALGVPLVGLVEGGRLGRRPRRTVRPGSAWGKRGRPPVEQRPLVGERGDRGPPAIARRADHVGVRHPDVAEEHLVEDGVAVHLAQRPHLDAGLAHGHHEERDAPVLGDVPVGAGQQHPVGGPVRGRVPHLLAVHDPLVAVALGPGRQAGEVRAAARFGEQLAPRVLAR